MGSESGRTEPPLITVLFDEPYRFDFFQAVRLLAKLEPDRQQVGRSALPGTEIVRFRTRASLQFPPSQIYELKKPEDEAAYAEDDELPPPPQMMVSFMGLTGPLGVLPLHYTELVMDRARYKDTAIWEFFDLFNHRMISLFYRAWEKHHFTVGFERGEEGRFTDYLFSIIGMGTKGLRGRLNLPDEGLLYYGGLIAQRPHSATAIAAISGDYFGVPARVKQFSGQWFKLDEESLSLVGRANHELGINSVMGTRVWDDQSKFRVELGPLKLERFIAFLPTGTAHKPFTSLARYLAGAELDFDMQLTLKASEVPGCVLTTRAKRKPMLGWTTWLKTQPFSADDSQVVLGISDK